MNAPKKRTSLAFVCGLTLIALPVAFAGHDADAMFKKMDANGDGKVSRAEHAAYAKQMFTECDANNDGIVTAAEMEKASLARGEKSGKHDKSAAEKIQVIDQNGDGQLTTAEHEAGSEKMFTQMDKDGDGYLSKEECEEGHKAMKKS